MNKFANILLDTRGAAFLCIITGLLVGAGTLTVFLVSTERSPFFIGDNMPIGVYTRTKKETRICNIEGCNNKHLAKGLCKKCYDKQYRQDNKKHIKQYRKDNKKQIAKQKKQYHSANKEHLAKCHKQWQQTSINKLNSRIANHNRRTLLSDLTKETVQRVYEDNILKYGILTCYLCGKPIEFGDDSLDHSTPLNRGGSNALSNLGIAHLKCNMRKYTMTLEEWFKKESKLG